MRIQTMVGTICVAFAAALPGVSQVVVTGGTVHAEIFSQTATTALPGSPELPSVVHTLEGLAPRYFNPSLSTPVSAEAIYDRSGDDFFLCAKIGVGFEGARGRKYGWVNVVIRNGSSSPMTVRVHGFNATDGHGAARGSVAALGGPVTLYQGERSYQHVQVLPPTREFSVTVVADSGSGPELQAIAVALITVDAGECLGQTVVHEDEGMVPGFASLSPILTFGGCAALGTAHIDLRVARPNAASALLIGAPGPGLPVLGGVLWPSNFGVVPLPTGTSSMGLGAWSLPVSVPPGSLGIYTMQVLVIDPDAVQGIAFSNALTLSLL